MIFAAPDVLGVALHQLIGGLPGHAFINQGEHDALREDQAARAIQVLPHAVGVDLQMFNHIGKKVEHIVQQRAAIGDDDPLGAESG